MNPESDPREIELEGPTAPLRILWEDAHESEYDLDLLRRLCPCAVCTQHGAVPEEERMTRELPAQAMEIKSIEETGNYALVITWRDGHNTGYYSFSYLRERCPCSLCRGQR